MMPTGPVPDIAAPTNLFDSSRRRAKLRKIRSATAMAAVAALLGVGGFYGLSQQVLRADTPLVPATSGPTQSTAQKVVLTTDAQLIAMTASCDSTCTVVGRVQTRDGNTFAVVGKKSSGALPNVPSATGFIVARGGRLVSRLAPPTTYPTYAGAPMTDSTGNVIVKVDSGNNTLWYLPFHLTDGKVTLVQGTFQEPAIVGDVNSGIVDADKDGRLEMVTVGHDASSGTRVFTYRSWRWDGQRYAARPCSPTATGSAASGPSCGLKAYPS